jgi:GNAT superfamily N-acetyltransferase
MGHKITPFGDDGVYYIKQIDPIAFTFNEALQFSELLLDSVAGDGLIHYWCGPRYEYHNAIAFIRNSLKDPRERLDAYIDKARSYKRLVHSHARSTFLSVLSPSIELTGLYTKQEGYERVVGMALWRYPIYMNKKQTIWHQIYALWVSFKYKLIEFFEFFGQGIHPVYNQRIVDFSRAFSEATGQIPNTPEETDRLATLTEDQLAEQPYPDRDYISLSIFMISPDYQRKGLGSSLLNFTLAGLREGKTPFVSRDGLHTSYGPPKQLLISSPAGRNLYVKCGFKEIKQFDFPAVGRPAYRMERAVTQYH